MAITSRRQRHLMLEAVLGARDGSTHRRVAVQLDLGHAADLVSALGGQDQCLDYTAVAVVAGGEPYRPQLIWGERPFALGLGRRPRGTDNRVVLDLALVASPRRSNATNGARHRFAMIPPLVSASSMSLAATSRRVILTNGRSCSGSR